MKLVLAAKVSRIMVNQVQAFGNGGFFYRVGTIIEIPRAALTANEIAAAVEFFSFGTNDLARPPSASSGTMWTEFCPIPFETVRKGFRKRNPFRQTCRNFLNSWKQHLNTGKVI
jgi:pyruvate,orthophosphate dikinase